MLAPCHVFDVVESTHHNWSDYIKISNCLYII
jgi:hypothetical protein